MRIACVQVVCPTYKLSLFKKLADIYGVDFYIGDKNNTSVAPNAKDLSFAKGRLKNYFFKVFGVDFLFQRGFSIAKIKSYDLIIIPISVPFFLNYKIIFWSWVFGVKVGMYGMGVNYQRRFSGVSGVLEWLRGFLYKVTSFSIVYTEEIKKTLVSDYGLDEKKIFVASNTLDVDSIINQKVDREAFRYSLGLKSGTLLISYVGRLSRQKRPDLLIRAVRILRERGLNSKVVFVGDGDERKRLLEIADGDSDFIFLGQKSEQYATNVLKSSDFSVMPGMTGLAVVHSFACKTVYITTQSDLHSPEFSYIVNRKNGFVVEQNANSIAEMIEYLVGNSNIKLGVEKAAYEFARHSLCLELQLYGFECALRSVGGHHENASL
uniref:glycosyltransferase family 4 protein n=1 Tax=Microbulbifer agarilyticus TaxID=260552 RepID=UPI0002FEE34F|nr:glycosyltransferase family 4 protein [Microbulbifer agarilyticus]